MKKVAVITGIFATFAAVFAGVRYYRQRRAVHVATR